MPSAGFILARDVVGFFGIGVSLVMFMFGLRHLGAARTSAYFSLAPVIGAALALVLVAEPLTPTLIIAEVPMGVLPVDAPDRKARA